jgi:hypothetical protein
MKESNVCVLGPEVLIIGLYRLCNFGKTRSLFKKTACSFIREIYYHWYNEENQKHFINTCIYRAYISENNNKYWAFKSNKFNRIKSRIYPTELCLMKTMQDTCEIWGMMSIIFWDVTPCSTIDVNWRFGGTWLRPRLTLGPKDTDRTFLRNIYQTTPCHIPKVTSTLLNTITEICETGMYNNSLYEVVKKSFY